MSGALNELEGVDSYDLEVGRLTMSATYDPATTSPDAIMEAIRATGEAVEMN